MTTLHRLIVFKYGNHGGFDVVDTVDSLTRDDVVNQVNTIIAKDKTLRVDYRLETYDDLGVIRESIFQGCWIWDQKHRQPFLHRYYPLP